MADKQRVQGSLADNGAYIPLAPPRKKEGLWDRMKSTPYVTAGVFTTAGILCVGIYSITLKNPRLSNYIMRARVASQAITVGLVMVATGSLTFGTTAKEENDARIYQGEESEEGTDETKPVARATRKVIF